MLNEAVLKEYRPTEEELKLINEKFAKVPHNSINNLYVFWTLAIDDQLIPSRFIKFDESALRQFVRDIEEESVSFLVAHNKDMIPIARVFKAKLTKKDSLIDLYTKQFMQKSLEIQGIKTDDFMEAYLGGTIQDVSISYDAQIYECSICGKDIRDPDCPHWPGVQDEKSKEICHVIIKSNSKKPAKLLEISTVYKGAAPRAKMKGKQEVPSRFVETAKELKEIDILEPVGMSFSVSFKPFGINKEGGEKQMFDIEKFFSGEYTAEELKELQIDVEKILAQEASEEEIKLLREKFSEEDLGNLLKEYPASELLIDELAKWTRAYINDLPNGSFAVIEPAYTRGETGNKNCRHLPHHDKDGKIDEDHLKNAAARANQIIPVTDSISTEELRRRAVTHLRTHGVLGGKKKESLEEAEIEIMAVEVENSRLKDELKTSEANNKVLLEQNTTLSSEITQLKTEMETIKQANVQLQKEVDELKPKAKDGEKYRGDLINEILELGIKLEGNNFDKANYEKLLKESVRTIDDIKKIRDQFLNTLCERFPGSRQTASPQLSLPGDNSQGTAIPDEAFKS